MTEVQKVLDPNLDVGNLLAFDPNDLNEKELSSGKEIYLHGLARDNIQILLNSIWDLPTQRVENCIVATLPKSTYGIPREKRIPKPKPLTKWQQYVKDKGLKIAKKGRLTWDDILKKWVPRYGYKKTKAEKEKNWIIEVPQNVDPMTDMFENKENVKQEKVSKNEFQRLRNIAKARNIKVPTMGLPPTPNPTSKQLSTIVQVANVSTASLGKFQPKLSKEKKLSKASVLQTKKRKLPAPTQDEERNRNLKLVDSILNKKPKLDLTKAVNREIHSEEMATAERKKEKHSKSKGQRKGGGNKKPKPGKGTRQFKNGGRKRR